LGAVINVALISGIKHSQAAAIRGRSETLPVMENPARDLATCYTTANKKAKAKNRKFLEARNEFRQGKLSS
jgi:hypothetical protein